MYYTGASRFIQFEEQMITKMKEVFRIFYENREGVVILWKPHSLIKTTLEQLSPELYRKYSILVKEYLECKMGILDESLNEELAVDVCDAYYGDASPMVQKCRNEGKPVMMQMVR